MSPQAISEFDSDQVDRFDEPDAYRSDDRISFDVSRALLAKLRDCKRDASDGTLEALQKIVPAIRRPLKKSRFTCCSASRYSGIFLSLIATDVSRF